MKLSPDPTFTPEQEVLLWAIRVDHTKDHQVAGILTAGVDWGYVRETAIRHGIIPLLYKRLKGEMADLVPMDELLTIRTLFLANSIRNIQMTQHLLKVLDLLAGSDVEAIPFKGPVLAVQAYGDLSMRSFLDLDILIHVNDLSRAYQILTDQGYILTDPGQMSTQKILRIIQQKDLRFTFQDDILELHWNVIEPLYAVPLDMDQVWDRSLPVAINGRKITSLSPEDLVIVLCFHGLKHGWQNLGLLADLTYTIANHPDLKWHDVLVRAEMMGLKRIVLIGLFLVHKYGCIRCGSEVENLFASDITMQNLASKMQLNLFQFLTSEPSFITPFLYLKSRERLRDKIMFIFYYFTNKVLVFLKWIVRHFIGIRTSPKKGEG